MGNCCANDTLNISGKMYVKTKANYQDLVNLYDIDRINMLGSGSYGKVFKATSTQDPSIKVAVKEIQKAYLSK